MKKSILVLLSVLFAGYAQAYAALLDPQAASEVSAPALHSSASSRPSVMENQEVAPLLASLENVKILQLDGKYRIPVYSKSREPLSRKACSAGLNCLFSPGALGDFGTQSNLFTWGEIWSKWLSAAGVKNAKLELDMLTKEFKLHYGGSEICRVTSSVFSVNDKQALFAAARAAELKLVEEGRQVIAIVARDLTPFNATERVLVLYYR